MKSTVNESLMNKDFHLTEMTIKDKPVLIYDNCLPSDDFILMREELLGPRFTWDYNSKNVAKKYTGTIPAIDDYDAEEDMYQFTHLLYLAGGHPEPVTILARRDSILNILNARGWLKIKANLGTKDPEHMVGGWHHDMHWPEEGDTRIPYDDTLTAILYMNTNNGYTLLETGYKVESVENRLVIFPNNVLHTGISQTDTNTRVIINFDFWM